MKNMWKYAMLLIAAAGCFACEDPEVGETLPDYYSKTFVTLQTSGTGDMIEADLVNTPIGVVPQEDYNRQVVIGLTKELDKDLTIELGADYSLVADRAAADGVNYKELPAEACVFSTKSVVIPAGQREAVVDLSLGDTSFASDVQVKETYLMPLVITKVSDSSVTISKQKQAAYCCVNLSYNILRYITSEKELVGMPLTGLTQEGGSDNIVDGNNNTYWRIPQQKDNIVVIDLGSVEHVTGFVIRCAGHDIDIDYSTDGNTWLPVGCIDNISSYFASNCAYSGLYGMIDARYLRMNFSARSATTYYWYVYEVYIYAAEFTEPYITLSTSEGNNEVTASVVHLPSGSSASVSGTISAVVSEPSANGYTAKFTVDNSLVDTYNAAHGTNYKPLPAGYLTIPDATIASMAYGAEDIKPELSGNLSALTEPGYLVPLRVSADGLKTSQRSGVVYVIVTTEYNDFMPSPTAANIRGALVSDRSGFSAANASGTALPRVLDGSTSTASGEKDIVVNMGTTYNISGLRLNYRYANYSSYAPVKLRISTSSNGADWTIRGTVNSSYWSMSGTYLTMILASNVQCQYVRIEVLQAGNYYSSYGLAEFDVYAE